MSRQMDNVWVDGWYWMPAEINGQMAEQVGWWVMVGRWMDRRIDGCVGE